MAQLQIVVCGSLVPDPLQTLEPVTTPQGPALKNEMMLPSVLDPWSACALYEAASLAAKNPGSQVYLVSLGPKAKLQHLMMTVAQKVPFQLFAIDGSASGFTDAADVADKIVAAINSIPNIDRSKLLVFGGCSSASRDAGVVMRLVGEGLGINEQFTAVDELSLSEDVAVTVLERVEGGKYLESTCSVLPAVVAWATGSLPEPPNNPQVGMANMRGIMPSLMKAVKADIGTGSMCFTKTEVPTQKRQTRIEKDMPVDEIAKEIVEWIQA